ncbi:N(5),N(10)-methenyltetrahydromethanopterin cyclohydrolase [Methanocaldococcus villosus KIN24-T80]|uniref:Methenyltetrahydromethanopterin cyclohydrolase n=1 Tax=Methanocaldococcus villosus KIN24-T80 TaxID=1069083 RepID=N6V0C5_9EURY|nr:methenyltetrahydromethanopterin cyclohydrolase [Methanocaldococcus villosus]ENN95773.1 N(5),N(10)-methenyltetrahydromethanopterin cyclohydrolase [Methanocaldococcus villosus KIN24-T80]
MLSINKRACKIVKEMIAKKEELNIDVKKLENGTTVLDCGVNVKGSWEAGKRFTRVCLGGLAKVGISLQVNKELNLPYVKVKTSHPAIATLASQKAGWAIKVGKYFAMGSGPARALAKKPKKTFEEIGYEDNADVAVLCLESSKLPNEEVADYIAKECNVEPENLYLLVAPTASLVGSIQISGRVVENGTYKMLEVLGFDVNKVEFAAGLAPIAPIVGDDFTMMGATNDMVMYGGIVYYYIKSDDDDLLSLCKALPSCSSKDYGKPFLEIFKAADYDFYKIDKGIFAPAKVIINDISKGKVYEAGEVNYEIIKKSLNWESVI